MGIITKATGNGPNSTTKNVPILDLDLNEVDCILRTLSVSHLQVKDIEILYNAIVKIQDYRKLIQNES